jgi:hypothetical protein
MAQSGLWVPLALRQKLVQQPRARLKCIQVVIDGELRPSQAAQRLAMSSRQEKV